MLTGTLITAAAFTPVGFARSAAGEYTFSIFAVVTIALLVSWVVAVLFTPYLGYRLLPEPEHEHDMRRPTLFQRYVQAPLHRRLPRLVPAPAARRHGDVYDSPFYRRFRRLVDWCVDYRKTVILVTIAVFALSIFGFRYVQNQFFPSSSRPELIVDLWLPQGASFQATEAQVKRLEERLRGDENIVNYVAYVGSGSPRFYLPLDQQLGHPNFAQFVIVTKNNKARELLYDRLNRTLEDGLHGAARARQPAGKRPARRLSDPVPGHRQRHIDRASYRDRGRVDRARKSERAQRASRLERTGQERPPRNRPEQGARHRRELARPGGRCSTRF